MKDSQSAAPRRAIGRLCSLRSIKPRVTRALLAACAVGVGWALPVASAVCATPGKDGVATSLGGVVNTYYSGVGTPAVGATSLTLGNKRDAAMPDLSAGDLVLVVQMQDGSGVNFAANTQGGAYGTGAQAGQYEYAAVRTVSTSGGVTTITFASGLTNAYVQNTASGQTYQVVRVPQYASATVSTSLRSAAWNGTTGGILALDVAGTLTLNADLDVSGQGFRGGAGYNGSAGRPAGSAFTDQRYAFNINAVNGGLKGEGTAGAPEWVFDGSAQPVATSRSYPSGSVGQGAPGNAGGGANDGFPEDSNGNNNQRNSGGGGGANAGTGGQGGFAWPNGTSGTAALPGPQRDAGGRGGRATSPTALRLFMGGGGGAGTQNNNGNSNTVSAFPPTSSGGGASGPISGSGAPGGGMIFVRTNTLVPNARQLNASGVRAYNVAGSGATDSAGGGGGGGSVFLNVAGGTPAVSITAAGGRGGDSSYFYHGPGGGGGGGVVVVSNNVSTTPDVAGGTSGVDGTAGAPSGYQVQTYGAAGGATGTIVRFTSAPSNGASSSSACLPQLTISKVSSTPNATPTVGTNRTVSYTITVGNAAGRATASNVSITDVLPSGYTLASTPAPSAVYAGTASGPFSVAGTSSLTFAGFTLPGGGSVALTFTVNVGTALGRSNNSATASYLDPARTTTSGSVSVTYDGTLSGNTGDDVLVVPPPNIVLSKEVRNGSGAFSTSSVQGKPGDVLEYCIEYRSTGGPARNFVLTDPLASHLSFAPNGYQAESGASGFGLAWTRYAANGTTLLTPTYLSNAGDADEGAFGAFVSGSTTTLNTVQLRLANVPGAGEAGSRGRLCFKASIR